MRQLSSPPGTILADRFLIHKTKSPMKSSGYSQSASLLAHNQIAATQLIRRGLPPPDTSKSPAYCFSQLKQGTYLIWLKKSISVWFNYTKMLLKFVSNFIFLLLFILSRSNHKRFLLLPSSFPTCFSLH